jgi:hypothetical protein
MQLPATGSVPDRPYPISVDCSVLYLQLYGIGAYYLHRNQSVVHQNFFGEEIGTYGGFVARAELLVDILVHQTCLSNTGIPKDLLSLLAKVCTVVNIACDSLSSLKLDVGDKRCVP